MRTSRLAALGLAAALCLGSGYAAPAAARVDVSFDFFYSNLSPHGSWLVSGEYGRIWQPAVYRSGWNPYYDGHWVDTDMGWTWASDYSWGAVPYHYGTWVLDPYLGWVWIPGYTWAPSWVVFSTGPDYIGWAPVPPHYRVGLSIGLGDCDSNAFVFVGARDFLAPHVRHHAFSASRSRTIVHNTTIVNNIRVEHNVVVNRGPDTRMIERVSGRKIRPERIEHVRNFAPAGHTSRADLRAGRDLRVAERVSPERSLPGRRGSVQAAKRSNQPERSPAPQASTRHARQAPAPQASTRHARQAEPFRAEHGSKRSYRAESPRDDRRGATLSQAAPEQRTQRPGKAKPAKQPKPVQHKEDRKGRGR